MKTNLGLRRQILSSLDSLLLQRFQFFGLFLVSMLQYFIPRQLELSTEVRDDFEHGVDLYFVYGLCLVAKIEKQIPESITIYFNYWYVVNNRNQLS